MRVLSAIIVVVIIIIIVDGNFYHIPVVVDTFPIGKHDEVVCSMRHSSSEGIIPFCFSPGGAGLCLWARGCEVERASNFVGKRLIEGAWISENSIVVVAQTSRCALGIVGEPEAT